MSLKSSPAPDLGLNMTPMIDIVFQLILFFLFNLRFKSLDFRIETELPKVGFERFPSPAPVLPHIRASLARLNAEDPAQARTKLKLGGTEWVLPDLDKSSEPARDALFAAVEARIRALHEGGKDLLGEIDCPPPTGGLVPHGDVVRVLDAFLAAGVSQVEFQGAAMPPIPRSR